MSNQVAHFRLVPEDAIEQTVYEAIWYFLSDTIAEDCDGFVAALNDPDEQPLDNIVNKWVDRNFPKDTE